MSITLKIPDRSSALLLLLTPPLGMEYGWIHNERIDMAKRCSLYQSTVSVVVYDRTHHMKRPRRPVPIFMVAPISMRTPLNVTRYGASNTGATLIPTIAQDNSDPVLFTRTSTTPTRHAASQIPSLAPRGSETSK